MSVAFSQATNFKLNIINHIKNISHKSLHQHLLRVKVIGSVTSCFAGAPRLPISLEEIFR